VVDGKVVLDGEAMVMAPARRVIPPAKPTAAMP
jgi:hypothetical protein